MAVEQANVIDVLGNDPVTGEVILIMQEARPWDGSDLRLYQLQEKLNAYLSFALDGEMSEVYPGLIGKPLRLELETIGEPDARTMEFIKIVREQIAFQNIRFEIRLTDVLPQSQPVQTRGGGCCGGHCSCSSENGDAP